MPSLGVASLGVCQESHSHQHALCDDTRSIKVTVYTHDDPLTSRSGYVENHKRILLSVIGVVDLIDCLRQLKEEESIALHLVQWHVSLWVVTLE